MPKSRRVMFYLRICGYSVPEIAAYLRAQSLFLTPKTIEMYLADARHGLRQHTQVEKVQARLRRAQRQKPWASAYAACQRCGTTTIAHRAYGYCYGCFSKVRIQLQRAGVEQRKKQYEWAHAFPACVECGTTAIVHRARGYCRQCYKRLFGKKPVLAL
ncbi:MAG: hypothetical protein H0X24_23560 [Ktedonobacterales bacterium]|nr:hypothetical protein [Ktedonobacterales bacterium]